MMLQIEKLSKSYSNDGGTSKRLILSELDLSVEKGETIAIVGPSGSGKSTLLNIIGTLDKPDDGSILVSGREIGKLPEKEQAVYRNKEAGFVFQLHHLLPQLNLRENILLPALVSNNRPDKSTIEHAEYLIQRLGLGHVAGQKPAQLSGGECQRTAVARALINKPGLLLADEPTGALDYHAANELIDLLVEINKEEKITLIVVTHSLEIARKMQKQYKLEDGKLIRME